ncbi:putative Ribosome maturation protein SBDS [Blattamonas nauphoetae]|uniref:Ribosome maturation protein SBDS n=1 Tax=Blattamonas nauphoetae TaxID=2049346 RepID=A0ABQ9XP70_9EUKA|nr:putative Ribosome maturation protein SBDS [Blattamonas nauphoetae]
MSFVKTPLNRKVHTNTSVVRLRRKGKTFEIDCYKNKVQNWRDKTETDLDEVLQITKVYESVSRGLVANKEVLKKCFKGMTEEEICILILNEGELQVSEKEREAQLSGIFNEVVGLIAQRCINTATRGPISHNMVETTLRSIHFNVHPSKPVKKQALDAIKALKEAGQPIERANMRLQIVTSRECMQNVQSVLERVGTITEWKEVGQDSIWQILANPGQFRGLSETISQLTEGKGRVDVLDVAAEVADADDTATTLSPTPFPAPSSSISVPLTTPTAEEKARPSKEEKEQQKKEAREKRKEKRGQKKKLTQGETETLTKPEKEASESDSDIVMFPKRKPKMTRQEKRQKAKPGIDADESEGNPDDEDIFCGEKKVRVMTKAEKERERQKSIEKKKGVTVVWDLDEEEALMEEEEEEEEQESEGGKPETTPKDTDTQKKKPDGTEE